MAYFSGKRYSFGGAKFPHFFAYGNELLGISPDNVIKPQKIEDIEVPDPKRNEDFIQSIEGKPSTTTILTLNRKGCKDYIRQARTTLPIAWLIASRDILSLFW